MPKVCRRVMIRNKQGLHARPAAMFVQLANRYKSDIKVQKGRRRADGKSIMGILSLGAAAGSYITIKAEGEDAQEAAERLSEMVENEAKEQKTSLKNDYT